MTGFIWRADRAVIRVFGRDPVRMIQGLATNDIAAAPENASVYTAFLTPKGKMVGDARVVRRPGGDIWIEADRVAAENIVADLRKYVPPLFARFDSLASHAVFGVYGARAEEVAATIPSDAVLRNPFRGDAFDLIITTENTENTERSARQGGAKALSDKELEVMRIEAGEPKWGAELTEAVIPLEAGLRAIAISETKGCYTGQEVIVRILHRGHVNRYLRGILAGATAPAPGAELVRRDDQKAVGRITSSCLSAHIGQAIALAYVRREVEPGTPLELAGRTVEVVELPFNLKV